MPKTPTRSVRVPDDEHTAAMKKGKGYNLEDFTAVVRFALQRLPNAKRDLSTNDNA